MHNRTGLGLPLNYSGSMSITVSTDVVEIEFTDETSGLIAGTLLLDATAFLQAIARKGNVACQFWLNESGRLGATREVKTVNVPFDVYAHKQPKDTDPDGYRTPVTVAALAPFEVDGWEANERDLWNGHNRVKDRSIGGDTPYQRVTFVRFVREALPVAAEEE